MTPLHFNGYIKEVANLTFLKPVETTLETYLVDKAPRLPEGLRKFIVAITPWITLLSVIITIPILLTLLGINIAGIPINMSEVTKGFIYPVTVVVTSVNLLLEALAIPGLLKRSVKGWRLLFYSTLIGAAYDLVTLNLWALVIGSLISLYLLFQIKSFYK